MEINEYWELVEKARKSVDDPADAHAVAESLKEIIKTMDLESIKGAANAYTQLTRAAYNLQLWGAAYVINGGCSDDGFDYFIGWLIGQGKKTYEKALADPDWLAKVEVQADEAYCEDMLSVATQAYEELTGGYPTGLTVFPLPELGPIWDFDDAKEMRRRYPKLYEKFM
ncbi:DUF4240 domain-containing protein [Achromobacter deleyi]|uniref:DUF4240 domain-containing protein n=1 Tax=Achromobacter deleyi TaxID=1353891 RepID=UPI001467D062|nr:DUF4240 domain-containing protein [Achromobacter deleyi]CAB3850365.1 hypothetical protein LMG3412_01721 [Achromobacter deleyi]